MLVKAFLILFFVFIVLYWLYRQFIPKIDPRAPHYRYALLLGCPSHEDGSLSTSQIKRCQTAIEAYRKGLFDQLIISGSNVKNKYIEAKEMEKYILDHFFIPITTETQAKNTYENLKYTKDLIGEQPLLIITSSLHAPRANAMACDFFKEHSSYTYPDRKFKHILREIISRILFIWIEIKKKLNMYP